MDNQKLSERLSALAEKATKGPWAYRPQEYDDWGVIRTTVEFDGLHPVTVCARYDGDASDEGLAKHRRDGTDPCGNNAALIVELVNALPAIISALQEKDL